MSASEGRRRLPMDPETLKAVAALDVRVRRVVEGLQGGIHASPHLGASVEFAEHKKYYPGDDIREIDWRAYARSDRYFVKQHQREVVLRCLLVLDCSASMGYRGARARADKLGFAVEILAAMAHILVRQGDAAGLMTFAARPGRIVPPAERPDHLTVLMSHLAVAAPDEAAGTGFEGAIAEAAERVGRRGMVVLASDLLGADRAAEVALARLSARGHDVVVFHVLDPDEIDLPFDRPAIFRGLEGEGDVAADPSLIREDYREALAAFRERWRRVCGEGGIDLVPALSSTPPALVLSEFAARRHHARRRPR